MRGRRCDSRTLTQHVKSREPRWRETSVSHHGGSLDRASVRAKARLDESQGLDAGFGRLGFRDVFRL